MPLKRPLSLAIFKHGLLLKIYNNRDQYRK